MARNKQTFRKSTSGKKAPVVRLPCMTPLPQPTQPKSRRRCTGTVALREIRKYQKDTSLLIPKTLFQCLVKEIVGDYQPDVRFQSSALAAPQEAAEDLIQYIVSVFEDTMRVPQHTHRETIQPRDMALVLHVRSNSS
ncbi:histone-like type 2 [Mycena olivaceomarginata]|nr:histone-like type 2 [Mycena olivaceomarginata]